MEVFVVGKGLPDQFRTDNLPFFSTRLPCAWYGKMTPAMPVTANG